MAVGGGVGLGPAGLGGWEDEKETKTCYVFVRGTRFFHVSSANIAREKNKQRACLCYGAAIINQHVT